VNLKAILCHEEEWGAQRHMKLNYDRGRITRAYKCKNMGKETEVFIHH
jgi:hypothetical protein